MAWPYGRCHRAAAIVGLFPRGRTGAGAGGGPGEDRPRRFFGGADDRLLRNHGIGNLAGPGVHLVFDVLGIRWVLRCEFGHFVLATRRMALPQLPAGTRTPRHTRRRPTREVCQRTGLKVAGRHPRHRSGGRRQQRAWVSCVSRRHRGPSAFRPPAGSPEAPGENGGSSSVGRLVSRDVQCGGGFGRPHAVVDERHHRCRRHVTDAAGRQQRLVPCGTRSPPAAAVPVNARDSSYQNGTEAVPEESTSARSREARDRQVPGVGASDADEVSLHRGPQPPLHCERTYSSRMLPPFLTILTRVGRNGDLQEQRVDVARGLPEAETTATLLVSDGRQAQAVRSGGGRGCPYAQQQSSRSAGVGGRSSASTKE